jgi:hypothetical protein
MIESRGELAEDLSLTLLAVRSSKGFPRNKKYICYAGIHKPLNPVIRGNWLDVERNLRRWQDLQSRCGRRLPGCCSFW